MMPPNPFVGAHTIEIARVRTGGSDERLRSAWRSIVGHRYRGKTVVSYIRAAENLLAHLAAQGLTLAALTDQALCDYLIGWAYRCRSFNNLNGQVHCRVGMFGLTDVVPSTCGLACPSYEMLKVESYLSTEKAIGRFMEFVLNETDYPLRADFAKVQVKIHEEFKKRRLREREDARYPRRALTNDEIAALFRACGHPRDRFVVALMLKTGLRHQEALSLRDGPELRARWATERLLSIETSPGVKRLGNPHAVIDDQLWACMGDYLRWKDGILRRAPSDDARRTALLLGKNGQRAMGAPSMSELWASAGRRAGIRIHPLREAPLTPHSARYTFCRLLEEAGFSSFWIARFRGDVQAPDPGSRSAWTYAKRNPAELREAYLARFPDLPM